MIAAIYARKSPEGERGLGASESVERQIEHAKLYISGKGWMVGPVFVDDQISGATYTKLEGRRKLIAEAEAGAFQAVVVSEPQRLGRHAIESSYTIMQITDAGARLFAYMSDTEIKTDTVMDQAQVMLHGFAGSFERKAASDRSRDKAMQQARAGLVSGGRCFGYDNQPGQGGKVRTINQAEAEIVRLIFAHRKSGMSHQVIRRTMNKSGLKGPGRKWKDKAPEKRGTWTTSVIRDILANSAYIGVVTWGKLRATVRRGRTVYVAQPEAEWITKTDERLRIIDPETWQAVQAMREQHRNATPRTRDGRLIGRVSRADQTSEHLLNAFLKCEMCGANIWLTGRVWKTKGGRSSRKWYTCSTHHTSGACTNAVRVSQDAMERQVFARIKQVMQPSAALDAALEALLARHRARWAGRNERKAQLQQDLVAVQARERRLVDAVADGGDALAPLVERLRAERTQRQTIEAALADLARETAPMLALDEAAYRRAARQNVQDVMTLMDPWQGSKATNIGPARMLLRRLLGDDGRIACTPTENGRGFNFSADLEIGAVLTGTVVQTGRNPNGFVYGIAPGGTRLRRRRATRSKPWRRAARSISRSITNMTWGRPALR